MKLGLISDVHGNRPALDAVLDDMPDVDECIHAGDVVGYGPYPEAVLEAFRERDIVSIQGNHDRAVLGDFHENFHGIPKAAALWTADRLSDDDLAYLDALPVERVRHDGRVRVVHGAPDRPNQYVYPEDFEPSLLAGEDVLVLGHTHMQASETFDAGIVVNPGSVGLPRDGDWRAAYAVLDLDERTVECRRVEYPKERVQARIEEYGLPEALVGGLEHGELVFGRTKRSVDDDI